MEGRPSRSRKLSVWMSEKHLRFSKRSSDMYQGATVLVDFFKSKTLLARINHNALRKGRTAWIELPRPRIILVLKQDHTAPEESNSS